VFSPLQASLDIMSDTLSKLQSIIKSNPYDVKKGPNLFYNEKGPGSNLSNGEIYIDCQPVGESDETTQVVTNMGTDVYPETFKDWLKYPLVQLLLGSLLFILILYFVKYFLGLIKPAKGGAITDVVTGGGKWI
jgi:hypothetical protein